MQPLTGFGQALMTRLSGQYGVSEDAVRTLLDAVSRGGGTMAQFSHPELGGSGQWMAGGMTMVGDMFNNRLKATVEGLCAELSNALSGAELIWQPLPKPVQAMGSGQQQSQGFQQQSQGSGFGTSFQMQGGGKGGAWWPDELGQPAATGSQNQLRYAYFPATRRLALDLGSELRIYDTGDHQISGFGQQQGGDTTLSFSSQFGLVPIDSLRRIDGAAHIPAPAKADWQAQATPQDTDTIFATIEKLGALRDKGLISAEEFDAKKRDLLDRL